MATKEDMSFDYNEITKQVTVVFRGKKTKLTPQFKDYRRAKEEAEAFCRQQGWEG